MFSPAFPCRRPSNWWRARSASWPMDSAINQPRRRVILPTGSVLHYMAAGTPGIFRHQGLFDQPENRRAFRSAALPLGGRHPARHHRSQSSRADSHRRGKRRGHQIPGARRCRLWPASSAAGFRPRRNSKPWRTSRQLREVRVWSRKPERREAFARRMRRETRAERAGRRDRASVRRRRRHRSHRDQLERAGAGEQLDCARHAHQRRRLQLGATPRTSRRTCVEQSRYCRSRFDRGGEDGIGRHADSAAGPTMAHSRPSSYRRLLPENDRDEPAPIRSRFSNRMAWRLRILP